MHKVYKKKGTKESYVQLFDELYVQLSNGRMLLLEDLVRDFESSLEGVESKLKVGEAFHIDRAVIKKNEEEIHRKCINAGEEALWDNFELANKIADENPDQYPLRITTYIFERTWYYKRIEDMEDMCKAIGDGMCDEVICMFELEMRICNGENVKDLTVRDDKLPWERLIKFRNGCYGGFGGGTTYYGFRPPATIIRGEFICRDDICFHYTPYAFRKESLCSTEHC